MFAINGIIAGKLGIDRTPHLHPSYICSVYEYKVYEAYKLYILS